MPWRPADAARHVDGLTPHQQVVWSRVANGALQSCLAQHGSQQECEGRAIRMANAVAQRAPKKSVKAADDGSGALDILAIPFGGPFEGGKDSDGEYFSERTDLALDWFPMRRPLLFHHGLDETGPGVSPVGYVDVTTARKTPEGWWVRAWLDKQHRYFAEIGQLIEEEALFASSGAMPHLVRKARDGEITRWPWVEQSLTPTPANLFSLVQPADAKAHYKAAGLTPPPTIDAALSSEECERQLRDDLDDVVALTRQHVGTRLKVGRAISEARKQRLHAVVGHLHDSAAEIEALLKEAEGAEQEPAPIVTTPARHGRGRGDPFAGPMQLADGTIGTQNALTAGLRAAASGDEDGSGVAEDAAEKAAWSAAYIAALPDAAFAVVLPGGTRDGEGKTVPRDLRKLPHHAPDGTVDPAHLRNALAREPQTVLPEPFHAKARVHLEAHAATLGIGEAAGKADASPPTLPTLPIPTPTKGAASAPALVAPGTPDLESLYRRFVDLDTLYAPPARGGTKDAIGSSHLTTRR
jgi:hypothetical protein